MKTALILLLTFSLSNCQLKANCPDSEKIYPCECRIGKDSKPWISCRSLNSIDVLAKAVKGMSGYSVSNFRIENSKIGVLPSDIFSQMSIQTLNIMKTQLTKLGEDRNRPPFLGLEDSLEMLEIKNAFTDEKSSLALLSLSHLKKLSSIHLDGNFIPSLGNNWFESGPYGLRDLNLYNTKTTSVGSHAFEALENLRTFKFNGNFITQVSRDMFPQPALVLEKMDLSMNKIKSLPDGMFVKMPSLEEIYLENNLLTTINEVVFAPIWSNLAYANFDSNPIICDSNIKWIYKYRTPANFRGRCAGPTQLENRELKSLTLEDFK